MSKPTSRYEDEAWWRAELAGAKQTLRGENDIHVGCYKMQKFKDGPWVPVLVWRSSPVDDDGELIDDEFLCCMVAGKSVTTRTMEDRWIWFCQKPVTYLEYKVMIDGPTNPEPGKPDPQPTEQPISLADADPVF